MPTDVDYSKEYRKKLGFSNQTVMKDFFSVKDIVPEVNYGYIDLLNKRLVEIIAKINGIVVDYLKPNNLEKFCEENIYSVYKKLKNNGIIDHMNNQWRRPEGVYFNRMRGYVVSKYFLRALSMVFEVDVENIDFIGDDDFESVEKFNRTWKADLEVHLPKENKIRIEIQSWFKGINDIKKHKVDEAKRIRSEEKTPTVCIHFDLFNWLVAFVRLDQIDNQSQNWIKREQMEGQVVFNIDQNPNYFAWKLTDDPVKYKNLDLDVNW